MEFNPADFDVAAGVKHWAQVFGIVTAIVLGVAFLLALITRGARGPDLFGRALVGTLKDIASISLGRVYAIAKLTFKEATRRKALLVFVVFCIIFMFAGWFMARAGDKPALQVRIYVSFVLTAITWLLLAVMLLLSCWGIPEDIRARSLHTVVTKPARRMEIVLGRITGFSAIGLLILAITSIAGYVWINRQTTEREKALLFCRIPVYGELAFLSDIGEPTEAGINVGDMWDYRSYIAGATRARAIWTFNDITPDAVRTDVSIGVDVLGPGQTAKITEWVKQAGEPIRDGELIARVEIDGRTTPLRSPKFGVLKEVFADEGATVTSADAIAVITHEDPKLESSFESFRTHKGNLETGGLFARYNIVNNRRAEAFAPLARSNNFRNVANQLRLGRYTVAADELEQFGNKMISDDINQQTVGFAKGELALVAGGFEAAAKTINELDAPKGQAWVSDLTQAFDQCRQAAATASELGEVSADFNELGAAVVALSQQIRIHDSALREYLTRLSVPLPAFIVREYRPGENVLDIPRRISFSGNNEDVTRFVTTQVQKLSDAGELITGDALVENLTEKLNADGILSLANAEQTARVLRQLVRAEDLRIENGRLVPADSDGSLYAVIQKTVDNGRLDSSDGWQLTADLYEHLVHDGELRVEAACLNAGQYLGMARPDLFIRLPDKNFASGYFKAVAAIGMMMVLIVSIGVSASCFVKGPVAIFLTSTLLVIGQPWASEFLEKLIKDQTEGGGPVESIIRIVKQQNPQVPLGINQKLESVVHFIDKEVVFGGLDLVRNIIPQFSPFTQASRFVEYGFDVPWSSCLQPGLLTLFGFLLPCVLVGFVSLRFRELEAK